MKKTLVSMAAILAATSAFAESHGMDLPQAGSDWYAAGQSHIEAMLARQPNTGRAKNVIVFVADGNGVGTNYAVRLFDGQQKGLLGEENVLPYETTDWSSALVKTYNINAQTPDSAPTAGAMNTGVKQRFNLINLGENGVHGDCATEEGNRLTTFAEIVSGMDKSVGIVSTARITHATPAAVYAKTANRNWEGAIEGDCEGSKDIATQLIDQMEAGVIDAAMGGGGRFFLPEGESNGQSKGRRTDGVNLIERATGLGAQFAEDTAGFESLTMDAPILALFNDSHMEYEADRADEDEPSLADMTRKTIEFLSQNENGFYMEVEAGRVDHANHDGNAYRTLSDGVAFAEAVALADEMTDDADTLIIVTADHEHAIAFNGYCGRGSDILGLCMGVSKDGEANDGTPLTAADGKPYTVIGYLNGAGSVLKEPTDGSNDWTGSRNDLTQEEATDIDYVQQALIPMSSETHSGEDVSVYAKGPWSHLFDSTIEQNVIFHVMKHAVDAQ
ncbi:alkaline phosphatase [Sagittula stellata]|uniref:Secreted alkaline phosphatase n=1 Tax=Sagittula stellata (strain ATCC 700073 / DSM 11524 / E-37) TaxID=388399 RepID=A3K2J7_SAGS3|nr:alkaline phosphatase [Sagittula stellata]EBA08406.1 secreted alkaline phosphatase [Sagittula stellata E-37]